MGGILKQLVSLYTIRFLKGYVTKFIKWSNGGTITNISNLEAPRRMSELSCQRELINTVEKEKVVHNSISYKS